jgi:hypothetical protein
MKPGDIPEFIFGLVSRDFGKMVCRFSRPPVCLYYREPLDVLIFKEVLIDREYENKDVSIGDSDKTIVDIGAGAGDFAVSSAVLHKQARIYAYEPDNAYNGTLKMNIQKNRMTNVTAYKKFVRRIDDVLAETGKIDFLKVDCEGGEYQIFDGISKKSAGKIRKISMEYHEFNGKTVNDLSEKLTGAGYLVNIYPSREVPGIGYLTAYNKV